MVASNLTLLAALTAKNTTTSGASGAQAADSDASREAGRNFARLVEKSSDKARDSASTYRFKPREATHDHSFHATTARSTDRLSASQPDRKITPKEASRMADHLDDAAKKLDVADKDPKALATIKEKLKAIADGGDTVSLKDLLAGNGDDENAMLALLNAASNAGAQQNGERISQLKQVLHFINKALGKADDDGSNDVTLDASATQQLCALPTVEAKPAEAPQLVTQITPLTNQVVIAAPSPDTVSAVPTEAIAGIDINASRSANAADMISPLMVKAEAKKLELPEVELPKVAAAPAATDNAAPARPAPATLPPAIERQLQALNDSQQAFANGLVKEEGTAVTAVKNNQPTTAAAGVQPTFNVGAATGPNAVNPVGSVAGGLLNHAPIREQVHVAISKASKEGVEQITIALEPQGLGRVEVKMHTGQDGKTSLSFLVDKPETFDALSRDARGLERALQDSGLKADSGGMQFNLRQQSHQNASTGGDSRQHSQQGASNTPAVATESVASATPTRNYRVAVRDGIDIHA